MKNVAVSVITPIYNRLSFVDAALKFLKAQTLSNIEFIIVDDSSTDGSYEYLIKKTKSDSRFKIYKTNQNSGPSAARNLALKYVQGKYIGFFDIDDEIPANYFELLFETAETNKSDIVFTSYNNIPHKNTGNFNTLSDKIESLRNGALWDKLFLCDLINQHNITLPMGRYCADNVFVFTAFYYAKQITLCNTPVYKYVMRPDSIGQNSAKTKKRKADCLYITQNIMDFIQNHDFDEKSLEKCYYFLTKSLKSYRLDKKFNRSFEKLTKKICQNNTDIATEQTKGLFEMLFLKLQRILGFISRQRYNQLVVRYKIQQSGLFDAEWYLAKNPDVKKAGRDPIEHYLEYGWTEGRNPSPKFDTKAYLSMNPDVALANMCPLTHYVEFGYAEGRMVCPVSKNDAQVLPEKPETLKDQINRILEYPLQVQNEYNRLKKEIQELESGK